MMTPKYIKLVDTPHYHLWTDMLHARSLARQARNRWDRSAYIRWAITTGWTTFEACCEEAVEKNGLGMRFKNNMNEAITILGLEQIEWGSGLWQKILDLYGKRKSFVHPKFGSVDLFIEIQEVEKAVSLYREGIETIYKYVGKLPPDWIKDDDDKGWDVKSSIRARGYGIHDGANPDDPASYKVMYVQDGIEYLHSIYPASYEIIRIEQIVTNMFGSLVEPVSEINVYKNGNKINSKSITMRGA